MSHKLLQLNLMIHEPGQNPRKGDEPIQTLETSMQDPPVIMQVKINFCTKNEKTNGSTFTPQNAIFSAARHVRHFDLDDSNPQIAPTTQQEQHEFSIGINFEYSRT